MRKRPGGVTTCGVGVFSACCVEAAVVTGLNIVVAGATPDVRTAAIAAAMARQYAAQRIDTVLVHAGAGGVGMAAIQVAQHLAVQEAADKLRPAVAEGV